MEKNHSFHTWITAHLILLHSPRFEGLCLFDWSTLFISLRYSVYLVEGLCLFHWDTLFIWLKDSVYLIEILCLFHWDTLFIWLLIFVSNRETTDSYTIAASPIFGSLRSNPSFYNTSQKPSFYRQSRSNLDVESKAPFLPDRNEESDKASAAQSVWSRRGSFAEELAIGGYGCSLTQTIFNGKNL